MSFVSLGVGGSLLLAGGLGAAGSLGSALIGSSAAQKASSQQVGLGEQALTQQQGMWNTAQSALSPYYTGGSPAAGKTLSSLLTPGANQTATLSQIPGFQFAQDWGQKAVQNIGTTTGLGGNTLTAGANFATGEAQQGFGSIVNALQNYYQTGAGAAGALGGVASNFGQQIGGTLTGIGGAQASGTLGSANAYMSGITGATGSIGSSTTNALLLSKLFPGNLGGANGMGGSIYGPQNASGVLQPSGMGGWS
jgi:hypothetical protein